MTDQSNELRCYRCRKVLSAPNEEHTNTFTQKKCERPFLVPDGSQMTDEQKLAKLIQNIEESVPYIEATLSPGNHFKSKERPDWIEIHGGRASSSYNQLKHLLNLAIEFKHNK